MARIYVILFGCLLGAIVNVGESRAQQTYPSTAPASDAGFDPIFDGKSLAGWEGDETFWRVENGALVGEITPGNEIKRNTFIIWRGGGAGDRGGGGGVVGDFELKLAYRISPMGNSGINYRSAALDEEKFAMKGYQFDIDGGGRKNAAEVRHTGNNYEERGRTFMALRGQMTRAVDGGKREVIGGVGDYKQLAKSIREADWNEVHIIARGNTLVHILNGQVMSILVDDDAKNRAAEGRLGVQVHTGPPMKVEYRDIRLKKF
jgi:hypothetical protein